MFIIERDAAWKPACSLGARYGNLQKAEIPVLELNMSYWYNNKLPGIDVSKAWIFCEKLVEVDPFVLKNWQGGCFFEQSKPVFELLQQTNDWEFYFTCGKKLRLTHEGNLSKIATSIPFSLERKVWIENLEALLFGQAGLLDVEKEDNYFKDLKLKYCYLLHKHQLEKTVMFSF
jgi:hypothetical protein